MQDGTQNGVTHGRTLEGRLIAVTRPSHQAEGLCRAIEAAGGQALRFPVIKIEPPADPQSVQARLQRLADYDVGIFVSRNAVHFTYQALGDAPLPQSLQRLAVGKATARALAEHGQPAHQLPPEPFNSEALLSLPVLQKMSSRRVIIFRGNDGRELLAETLRGRGAQVDYAEVYRRSAAMSDPKQLYQALDTGNLDMIVVTSNEGLQNLLQQVDTEHRPALLQRPLVVISRRGAELAERLGFRGGLSIAETASDAALLEAIKGYGQER